MGAAHFIGRKTSANIKGEEDNSKAKTPPKESKKRMCQLKGSWSCWFVSGSPRNDRLTDIDQNSELLYSIDVIYFFDILAMLIYKVTPWEEAKQIYRPRNFMFILLEIIALLPVPYIYQRTVGYYTNEYYYIRMCFFSLRILRLGLYFWRIRHLVGVSFFLNIAIEFLAVELLYASMVNVFLVKYTVDEEYQVQKFFYLLSVTFSRLTGKGITPDDDLPCGSLLPLLLFTFIAYMMYIFYMGSFIAALNFNVSDQFVFVNSMEKILSIVLKWKYQSGLLFSTVQECLTLSWERRRSLCKVDTYDYIIPEIMTKEIKLDICWAAFKHSHIFRYMESHYLRYLSTLATVTYLTPGELVFKKGKFKSRMVYIVSGVLQCLSEEDGETPILSFSSGTCLGETSLFMDQPSSCTVVVKNYSEVIILEKRDFFQSHRIYPKEFEFLLKHVFKRINDSKHFMKINLFQFKMNNNHVKSQVLTMKWLKKTLYKLIDIDHALSDLQFTNVMLDERMYDSSFEQIIFCTTYLDLMVIANEYQLSTDAVVLKYTFPIIFQPDTSILFAWKMLIAVLSYLLLASYSTYMCFAKNKITQYTVGIYMVTLVWQLDIYLQFSTAIVTKETVIIEFYKIIIGRLSNPVFFLDIAAAVPIEGLFYIMIGETTPFKYHLMMANRLLKCYRLFDLFEIKRIKTADNIVTLKYVKLVLGMLILLTNLSGLLYMIMCQNDKCSSYFEEFIRRMSVDLDDSFKTFILLLFLSIQFIGGLIITEFIPTHSSLICIAQLLYYFADMYLLADVAAAETLRNKNKLKYHEFVKNVNIVMDQWEFDKAFKKRVGKYCVIQWQYDNARNLLLQENLLNLLPFNLFKIGQHISSARSISHVPLFQQVPDDVLAMFCVKMERTIIPIGEVITYSGEVCNELYIIESGYCQMIAQSRTTAKVLGPGDSFSVLETCLNVSTVNTVITLSDCKILSLTYENYLNILMHFPHVLAEINISLALSVDWVGFEQLLNKEFLDIESFTPISKSFNYFGYYLDKDSKEYEEFHIPFKRNYSLKSFRYILLRMTITPHGQFIKYWEWSRCFFATITCLLSSITIYCCTNYKTVKICLFLLDFTAYVDIYIRHHISYFNELGIEVTHPLCTAIYYWKHGFVVDLMSALPFEVIIPSLAGYKPNAKMSVFMRLPRLLQGVRVYNMFNYYILTKGSKAFILIKYFLMVLYFQMLCSFFIINTKCSFDIHWVRSKYFTQGVECDFNSWITPKDSFVLPLTPSRVYAYGHYFVAIVTTFKGLEGFIVSKYSEAFQIVVLVLIWLCLFPYFNAKIIAHIMYRNVGLVKYQNAMAQLIDFMKLRKIDPVLKREVVKHFEHIWSKKKGRKENEIFKVFNIALHEDALYHIYGKTMQGSSIFREATKSFFKSLFLNVNHEIVLKRGIISKVNNVHGTVYFLFKGQVLVLGPDNNRLLTLPPGSVFGHLDNINRGRQTLSYVAKGHVELLAIDSKKFYSILAKYRNVRTYFKSLITVNVDYLVNTNEIIIPDHITHDPSFRFKKVEKHKFCKKSRMQKLKYIMRNCCHGCLNIFCMKCLTKVHVKGTVFTIWETIVLGGVCFIGSMIEFYQKCSQDQNIPILCVLYLTDFMILVNMYFQFSLAYEDDRGLLVMNRKLIAKRYVGKLLGFKLDCLSTVPLELISFFFKGETSQTVFTYCRLLRLLRVVMVIEYFHSVNQKLNINVMAMRLMYLTVVVTLILQFLVFFLFSTARFDTTMELYQAHLLKNNKFIAYLRQIKVTLHMFIGTHTVSFKPNTPSLVLITTFMMIFTRFIIAMFIAETCATLETVLYNKTTYEKLIAALRKSTLHSGLSMPLFSRMWLYVQLLWAHHKGEQFPYLLLEAPYYLREGILNSMFGYHIRLHPILHKCHMDMIRQMAACMTTRIFFSGDFITFMGDIDECMYFIQEGEVCALSEDSLCSEIIEQTFTIGQMFGLEQGLYARCGHTYTYKANCYTVVVMLKRKDWIHLFDYFPASKYLVFHKDREQDYLHKFNMKEFYDIYLHKMEEDHLHIN